MAMHCHVTCYKTALPSSVFSLIAPWAADAIVRINVKGTTEGVGERRGGDRAAGAE